MTSSEFSSLYEIVDEAGNQVREFLDANAKRVNASKLGLDSRCGNLWVTDEAVVCMLHQDGNLRYYGGFEYVEPENVCHVGKYVIYFSNDSRVEECIERYQEGKDNE